MQGLRKPALAAYECVAAHLQQDPGSCIFIDDRQVNIDGAKAAGMQGILFKSAEQLQQELHSLGVQL